MLKQCITLLGIALALSASGCGGDQTSDQNPTLPSANTAEGLWAGTTDTNRTLTTAVLDDGTYYFFWIFPPSSGSFCAPVLLNALSDAAFLAFSSA